MKHIIDSTGASCAYACASLTTEPGRNGKLTIYHGLAELNLKSQPAATERWVGHCASERAVERVRYYRAMTESNVYFRASVGILVLNGPGLVLALERSDIPGAWQAPQGGLQFGEKPVEAAERELREETGIRWPDVSLIGEFPEWLAYELPADSRSARTGWGQVQKWFLVRLVGSTQAVDLMTATEDPEFAHWQWMPFLELVQRTWEVRRPIYYRLASHWSQYLA